MELLDNVSILNIKAIAAAGSTERPGLRMRTNKSRYLAVMRFMKIIEKRHSNLSITGS